MKAGTLVIERIPGLEGVWLCDDDGKNVTPLAQFLDEERAHRFVELHTLARSVSHAQGQMGI